MFGPCGGKIRRAEANVLKNCLFLHRLKRKRVFKTNTVTMLRGLSTIVLLVISNAFMTLAWYGHIAFKSRLERFGLMAIVLLSWGIALFEYCFQVPANRIGSAEFGGPFSIWELKVIQEVVSLSVFTVFALVFMRSDSLRWNHLAGFLCLILAVYFIFRK